MIVESWEFAQWGAQCGDMFREGIVVGVNRDTNQVTLGDPYGDYDGSCWESVVDWKDRRERWIGIMAAQHWTWAPEMGGPDF